MNATEYGNQLADQAPPLTDEQVEAAARVLAMQPQEVAA